MATLSKAAMQLLLDYEVGGGAAYYAAKLMHPTWPGGESGVTIGIGYDLGYTPRERFLGDWASLNDDDRERLSRVIGPKGLRAREATRSVRDIEIPWGDAFAVFQARTIPYWIAQTEQAFPGAAALPADAHGALVSLVFNRGPALEGSRRTEMRWIRDHVAKGNLAGIAKSLRAMKRLWVGKGLPGLLKRREAEAAMVEGCV